MKLSKLIVGAILMLQITEIKAQEKAIDKLISIIGNAEVIKNGIAFKADINAKMDKLKTIPISDAERYNNLRLAYTEVYEKHDAFIKSIKSDMANTENIKLLMNNFSERALTYQANYEAVKQSYEIRFSQAYNDAVNSGQRGIAIGVLIKFGIDAFKFIAASIKNHKIDKTELINLLLPRLNEGLFNKLKLKTWSEWDIKAPLEYKIKEEVVVPARSINTLSGSISFLFVAQGSSQEQSLIFNPVHGSRDIQVVSSGNEQIIAAEEYFISADILPVGTKFRMQVNSTGLIYVFALNSTGIILLHPGIGITKSLGRDITITGDETPATGQIYVPANSPNGSPRFFQITPNADGSTNTIEEMAIILSKSELVLEEIIEKLNQVVGTLSQRFASIFSEKEIPRNEANINQSGNSLSFNADASERNILPLVFKIKK